MTSPVEYDAMDDNWFNTQIGRQQLINEVSAVRFDGDGNSTVSLSGNCEVEFKIDIIMDDEGQPEYNVYWRWHPASAWMPGHGIVAILPIKTAMTTKHTDWEVDDFTKEAIRRWTIFCNSNVHFFGPNSCADGVIEVGPAGVEANRPVPFWRSELTYSCRTLLSFEAGEVEHVIAEPGLDAGATSEIVYLGPHSKYPRWWAENLNGLRTALILKLLQSLALTSKFANRTAELMGRRLKHAQFVDDMDAAWANRYVTLWGMKSNGDEGSYDQHRKWRIGIRKPRSEIVVIAGKNGAVPHDSCSLADGEWKNVTSILDTIDASCLEKSCRIWHQFVVVFEGQSSLGELNSDVSAAFHPFWRQSASGITTIRTSGLMRLPRIRALSKFMLRPMTYKPNGSFLQNAMSALSLTMMEARILVINGGLDWEADCDVPSFALTFTEECRQQIMKSEKRRKDTCPQWLLSLYGWRLEQSTTSLRNNAMRMRLTEIDGLFHVGPKELIGTNDNAAASSSAEGMLAETKILSFNTKLC